MLFNSLKRSLEVAHVETDLLDSTVNGVKVPILNPTGNPDSYSIVNIHSKVLGLGCPVTDKFYAIYVRDRASLQAQLEANYDDNVKMDKHGTELVFGIWNP